MGSDLGLWIAVIALCYGLAAGFYLYRRWPPTATSDQMVVAASAVVAVFLNAANAWVGGHGLTVIADEVQGRLQDVSDGIDAVNRTIGRMPPYYAYATENWDIVLTQRLANLDLPDTILLDPDFIGDGSNPFLVGEEVKILTKDRIHDDGKYKYLRIENARELVCRNQSVSDCQNMRLVGVTVRFEINQIPKIVRVTAGGNYEEPGEVDAR